MKDKELTQTNIYYGTFGADWNFFAGLGVFLVSLGIFWFVSVYEKINKLDKIK